MDLLSPHMTNWWKRKDYENERSSQIIWQVYKDESHKRFLVYLRLHLKMTFKPYYNWLFVGVFSNPRGVVSPSSHDHILLLLIYFPIGLQQWLLHYAFSWVIMIISLNQTIRWCKNSNVLFEM